MLLLNSKIYKLWKSKVFMGVKTRKEFERFSKKVESELEVTLQERRDLGLSVPSNYSAFITFYNSEGALATANFNNGNPQICVNVAPQVQDYLSPYDQKGLLLARHYFDIARDFIGNPQEEEIFKLMENPRLYFRKLEKRFPSKKELKKCKDFFKDRGKTYESYKQWVMKGAQPIREIIQVLLPEMESAFERTDLVSLRHEIDHLDFFDSNLYLDFYSKMTKAQELQIKLHLRRDRSSSEEYALANMGVLEKMAEVIPLSEVRALFFNYLPRGNWDKIDFKKIKSAVSQHFSEGYIEGNLPEGILDKLVSLSWSEGEMDRQTSNYLFKKVNEQIQSPNASRYIFCPEKVNECVANKILNQELPKWKNLFAKNTETAIEVVGNAYRDNPQKLGKTRDAKTFQEFIEILT
jgi:hypothetical protein